MFKAVMSKKKGLQLLKEILFEHVSGPTNMN